MISGFAERDGRYDLEAGENIADLEGIHIAHDALFDGTSEPKGGDGLTTAVRTVVI